MAEFGNQDGSTPKNLDITIQGTKIKSVENTKYFGIIFDSFGVIPIPLTHRGERGGTGTLTLSANYIY